MSPIMCSTHVRYLPNAQLRLREKSVFQINILKLLRSTLSLSLP